ncbi:plasmid mobilization protein [Coprococcus catus]
MKHSVIEVESSILRMEIYIANRTRDIPIQFFVTAEEKKMIRKKILLSKTANMGAYLRKMAIDGIIVNTDTTYLEKHFLRCTRSV